MQPQNRVSYLGQGVEGEVINTSCLTGEVTRGWVEDTSRYVNHSSAEGYPLIHKDNSQISNNNLVDLLLKKTPMLPGRS